jgi:hypothetical protein
MAGGWTPAARLPLEDALAWADEHLQGRAWASYTTAYQAWASMLPAFAMGGTPPDPPEPPED